MTDVPRVGYCSLCGIKIQVAIFKGDVWCCENHRKELFKEPSTYLG